MKTTVRSESAGDVDIDASTSASIDATIVSCFIFRGRWLERAGIGASIGVGCGPKLDWLESQMPRWILQVRLSSMSEPTTLTSGDTGLRQHSGARAGDVYQYVGEQPSLNLSEDVDDIVLSTTGLWRLPTSGTQINLTEIMHNPVKAYIQDSQRQSRVET